MLTFKSDNGQIKTITTLVLKETKMGKLTIDKLEDYPAMKIITKDVLGETKLYITSKEYDKILIDNRYALIYEIVKWTNEITLTLTQEEFNSLSQLVWWGLQDYDPEKDKFGYPVMYASPLNSEIPHIISVKRKMEKFQ